MYLKLFLFAVILAVNNAGASPPAEKVSGARQKRLLFYDEEGNLVKTYKNPQSLDFIHNAEKVPFFGSFFSMFRPSTLGIPTPTVYMIPVSDQVIQQINKDPVYQNKFFSLPRKELVIEPNTLCAGMRTQIPSKDCRNFLNCWDGWAFEQECPEGLLFSKDGFCDYPHNVDCGSRMNDPALAPPAPQCSKEFEAVRSAQTCNEFFVCVDRTPVWFRCPSDLVFNQELGVCDYAYRVNCVSSPNKEEASSSQPKPAGPAPPPPGPAPAASGPAPAASVPASAAPPCAAPAEVSKSPGLQTPGSADSVLVASPTDSKSLASHADFSSQSWPSIHLALSRLDAIRQLKIREGRPE